jgi:D-arabinose 1-dehydrogenase-like Zn-dependent alcohol dehydrogenase
VGLCPACRIGDDMRCAAGLAFTGCNRPGGFAELLKTTDRGGPQLPTEQDPPVAAATPDAGLTVMHVVRNGGAACSGTREHGSWLSGSGLGHIARAMPPFADRGAK